MRVVSIDFIRAMLKESSVRIPHWLAVNEIALTSRSCRASPSRETETCSPVASKTSISLPVGFCETHHESCDVGGLAVGQTQVRHFGVCPVMLGILDPGVQPVGIDFASAAPQVGTLLPIAGKQRLVIRIVWRPWFLHDVATEATYRVDDVSTI